MDTTTVIEEQVSERVAVVRIPAADIMTTNWLDRKIDATRERMLRELASDLADLVASGDLTEEQANEWSAAKADQWIEGSLG